MDFFVNEWQIALLTTTGCLGISLIFNDIIRRIVLRKSKQWATKNQLSDNTIEADSFDDAIANLVVRRAMSQNKMIVVSIDEVDINRD